MIEFFDRWFAPGRKSLAQKSATSSNAYQSYVQLFAGRDAQWSSKGYAAQAAQGYMRNPIAFRAISLIAQAAARVPFDVVETHQTNAEHPAKTLLTKPNADLSGPELIEQLFTHLMIGGNAYLELIEIDEGRYQAYALRPDRVQPVLDRDGWIAGYDYRVGSVKRRIKPNANHFMPLVHFRGVNPLNDQLGLAPIEAAMNAIDTHNKARDWHKALLDNAARPSGALVYNAGAGNLTNPQFERLKEELNASFQGAANAGRPMVLEGGLDWKSLSMTPRDMDFIETKNVAAREIALALGVPPMLLCLPGDNTYSNYKEANKAFWRQTMIPYLIKFYAILTKTLGPLFDGDWQFKPNFEAIEAIADERLANWSAIDALGALTEDEKRTLFGLPNNTSNNNRDLKDRERED
jgi:HK97 family phage portal protein